MADQIVPVIMHHSIGIPHDDWRGVNLTCHYKTFESQLNWLAKNNFKTISLAKLYNYLEHGNDIPDRSIVLTFDDGYLDNWVFAYPLLKKYNFQGTIFPPVEFIDEKKAVRNNLFDVWDDRINISDLKYRGYLSWKELSKMENEGVMDVQSHTMTHTWYFSRNEIIDFRHPNDKYVWMTWNDYPGAKPNLQVDDEKLVKYGQPVYENNRAIGSKRYFPDNNLDDFVIDYVEENGAEKFFDRKNWKEELFEAVDQYKNNHQLNDRYETDKEYEERIYFELKHSKEVLERKLNKEIEFLCWPGGAVDDTALKIAEKVGYKTSTIGRDIYPRIRKKHKNKKNSITSRFDRISTSLYNPVTKKAKYKNGFLLGLTICSYKNKMLLGPIGKLLNGILSQLYKFYFKYKYNRF